MPAHRASLLTTSLISTVTLKLYRLWSVVFLCWLPVISNDASVSKGYQIWPGEMLNTQGIHTALIQPAGRLLYIKAKQAVARVAEG